MWGDAWKAHVVSTYNCNVNAFSTKRHWSSIKATSITDKQFEVSRRKGPLRRCMLPFKEITDINSCSSLETASPEGTSANFVKLA